MTDRAPIKAYQISPRGIQKVFEDPYDGPAGDLFPFMLKMSGDFFPLESGDAIDPAGANDWVVGISCDGGGIAMLVALGGISPTGLRVVYMPDGPNDTNPYTYDVPFTVSPHGLPPDTTRRSIVLYDSVIYVLATWDAIEDGWQVLAITPTLENGVWTGENVDTYQQDQDAGDPKTLEVGEIAGSVRVFVGGEPSMTEASSTVGLIMLDSTLTPVATHSESSFDVNDLRLWYVDSQEYLVVAHATIGAFQIASVFQFTSASSFPSRIGVAVGVDANTDGTCLDVTPERLLLGLDPTSESMSVLEQAHLRVYRPIFNLTGVPQSFEIVGDSFTASPDPQKDLKRVIWSGADVVFVLTGLTGTHNLYKYSLQDMESKAQADGADASRLEVVDQPTGIFDADTNGPHLYLAGVEDGGDKVIGYQVQPATRVMTRYSRPRPPSDKWLKRWDF